MTLDPRLFDWVPFYEEFANKLRPWRKRQSELVAMLEELKSKGFVTPPVQDQDAAGNTFPLREIDPFTFLASLNRSIKEENRRALAQAFKERFDIIAPSPMSFAGIPLVDNRRTWFIAYSTERKPTDVSALWDVFEAALEPGAPANPDFARALDEAWKVKGVRINITMGLFWIRPRTFISLDNVLLKHVGYELPSSRPDSGSYLSALNAIAAKRTDFAAASYEAWLSDEPVTPAVEATSSATAQAMDEAHAHSAAPIFWFVGAAWGEADQTDRFLKDGVWENGHEDRLLDEVRSMRVGERIAIKATYTRKRGLPFETNGSAVSVMAIKAIGTIVGNPGDGKRLKVDWEPLPERREWYFYTSRQTIWGIQRQGVGAYQDLLISFAFEGAEQNHQWFLDHPYWQKRLAPVTRTGVITRESEPDGETSEVPSHPKPKYTVDDILSDGAFAERLQIERIVSRLRSVRNVILQGPPGVGKTWFAKRIAFALMGERDDSRITRVQFHQSTSYEDFVRGLRPQADKGGTFVLVDGPFLEASEAARADPDGRPHVVIIEEVNRGNPSQIFGELLTLLEADKRSPEQGLRLSSAREGEPTFYVPENLYVIGTMNLADRSLAIVDFALRRRFAFENLTPAFEETFRAWVTKSGLERTFADNLGERMIRLNKMIADDPNLGPNYGVGHSYLCPAPSEVSMRGSKAWYIDVVETQILPLLEEYWFDARQNVENARKLLLTDLP